MLEKTKENEDNGRMRIRNYLPIEDTSDDDLADKNKWDNGRIINNFKAAPSLCTQCN